ncbi:MAG: type II toxin-antitoxin system PemK/MazF family toxin [Christensenellales bacterium]
MEITRGDIFIADLNPVQGSEQGGIRPVLVIQNDQGNRFSPTVICAAMTRAWAERSADARVGQRAGQQRNATRWCSANRSGRWKAPPAPRPDDRRHGDGAGRRGAAVRAGHRMTGNGTKLSMRGGKRSAA